MRTSNANVFRVLMAIALIAVFTGCAERNDPTDIDIAAHPSGWLDPSSEDFHGEYVEAIVQANAGLLEEEQRTGVEGCASCHGADLGRSTGDGCYDCHARGNVETGGHPAAEDFIPASGSAFHGDLVIEEMGVDGCQSCHGLDYRGGWADSGCFACHPGPSGHPAADVWLAPANEGFHGAVIAEAQSFEKCGSCHGADYSGGWAELACTPCHGGGPSGHPASAQWLDPGSGDFHGDAVQDRGVNDCKACHGSGLNGGWSGSSCIECHSSLGG